MIRETGILFVVAALMNFTVGCTTTRIATASKDEIPSTEEKIVSLVLVDGSIIRYTGDGGMYRASYLDRTNVVVGLTQSGVAITPVDSVLEIRFERKIVNVPGTIVVASLAALGAAGLVVIASSCPYVYSFDGERYRFDGEPLGGATTEGLKRTDYSRLDFMKPGGGEYRLLVRNEADESQFIDQLDLVLVDHPSGVTIAPDYAGNFYSFRRATPPLTARDERGRDVGVFFAARDDVKWQSKLPTDTSFRGQDLRHHLTFTFPKPKSASTLKLLVNAGTAQWGSGMIRDMLDLRGSDVDSWYKDVDAHGPELQKLMYFMDREELFTLKVNVLEGSSWVPRGLIHGGGPMKDEDRIIEVDVSHVEGETVTLRINPPRGYWKIDCINSVDSVNPVSVRRIFATSAQDAAGTDVRRLLQTTDNNYYTMPEVGERCELRFPVPDQPARSDRTVFLECSGYYHLHLARNTPQQSAFIQELGLMPGRIVSYSLERYLQWYNTAMTTKEGPR